MPGLVTAYLDRIGLIAHRGLNRIVNARRLFLQAANIRNKRINFRLGQLLLIAWHFAPAIHDRVENTFIADIDLPLRVRKVAGGPQLALEGFALPSLPWHEAHRLS